MLKRLTFVCVTLCVAIVAVLVAARHSTGNAISFEEPLSVYIAIGLIVVLFLPPLILSFFEHPVLKIVNVIYQSLIVFSFVGLIPVGFLIPNGSSTIIVAVLGTVASLASVIVTVRSHSMLANYSSDVR
ncbi:hypothetical protein AYO36_06755 [Exiguobacterium sp. KKBO11]|uniref:hypothetical protein n=1 Tax=Exiguobacterium sp. KKBO11 TaxID=1805000 RepID=UPI0007D81FC8|nr:hypothetical protein [Exiguobacterium sp. KKBO11]OAI87232.1 hypothetical protein AYO36_06755 [Exiguobacterium sp. KKBO11]